MFIPSSHVTLGHDFGDRKLSWKESAPLLSPPSILNFSIDIFVSMQEFASVLSLGLHAISIDAVRGLLNTSVYFIAIAEFDRRHAVPSRPYTLFTFAEPLPQSSAIIFEANNHRLIVFGFLMSTAGHPTPHRSYSMFEHYSVMISKCTKISAAHD